MVNCKHIVLFLFFTCALTSYGQDKKEVSFTITLNKEKLGINERLRVEFEMNKDGDDFEIPNFEDFKILAGPLQQINRSWSNGVRRFSKTYSFILQPTKKGKLKIKQAAITIDKQVYKTPVKTVEVTSAVSNPNAPPSANDIANENLYLVAEVSKSNPYLNEAISVVYKLYVGQTINVTNSRALDNPKYNNFWSQDIPVTKYQVKETTFKGKPFNYVVLKRVVLYPQKSGKLELEPYSLDISLEVPTNQRGVFGGRVFAPATKIVSAGGKTINVKALPEEGKPASFTGAVGDFSFFVSTTKSHLNAAESLQAKVEVSGKGNLKLFNLPQLNLPSSLEVYEPEHDEKVRTNYSGMEGKINDSYTVVPTYRGKYPIPSIAFSYFNPKTKKYHTLNSEEKIINVIEGPTNGASNNTVVSGTNKQAVMVTGEQFSFIKLQANLKPIGNSYFFKSNQFYLLLLLPLLLIPLAILFGKKREAIASDVAGNRIKKANKLARKYLSAARKTLGNKEAFYIALEKALHNYLKAKLKIETSEFSKDKISALLLEKNVDTATSDGFIFLLKNCEMARYSPFSEVQIQQDYDKASEVISQMDKQL